MVDSLTDTLKEIKLTKKGKTSPTELEYVRDAERAEILADRARSTILAILRKGIPDTTTTEGIDEETGQKLIIERHLTRHALSIVELARLSNDSTYAEKPITKSQVIHHLPILIEYGYVEKYGTLKSGKRSTEYYRRTSNLFVFMSMPGRDEEIITSSYKNAICRMEAVFDLTFKKSEEEELLRLLTKAEYLMQEGREYVVGKARSDIARTADVDLHKQLYRIYAFKHEEWIETNKRIREIIFPD